MTDRRSHLILIALILAALVGSALLILPQSPVSKEVTLGLDLQGGLEVTLQAVPPPGEELEGEDLERSVGIMRDRVDRLGVTEPEIRTQHPDQIVISLPGIEDPERAASVIGQTAQLELYDLEASALGPSIDAQGNVIPHDNLFDLLASGATQTLARDGEPQPWYLFEAESKRLLAGPLPTREALLETDAAQALEGERGEDGLPEGYRAFGVPEDTIILTCGRNAVFCPGVGPPGERRFYYLFRHTPDAEPSVPQVTGEHLELGGTRADFDTSPGGGGRPIVTKEFTDEGARRFHEVTRDLHARGRLRDMSQHFAIVLDREIRSFPRIDHNDPQLADGIRGGRAQITGLGSIQEAQELALVLQTGALPVEFRTMEQVQISATLGEDSLRQALRAGIAGLLLTGLFLLLFYRLLGVVAVIALGIYAIFFTAAILLFNVTLTLPGFAGMILTIGVAADANIVIFERIKEEFRAGKSMRAAISTGYAKGFRTIIDANAVTAITALVLFTLATAGVKGFALMLLVGITISMFTAVFATRAMLGLLAGLPMFSKPRLLGASARQRAKWMEIDFVGKRRYWFAISGVAILISIGALFIAGLNLGIEFRGGTQIRFTAPEPAALQDVRAEAAQLGRGDAQIVGMGAPTGPGEYTAFQIRTEPLEQAQQQQLLAALRQQFDADPSVTTVSASFGRQIAQSALLAILFSLILIVIYISIRFQWKFSVPVARAIFHDVAIVVGIFALTGRQMTTATVAALLTILGYAIYDTIIIFDRVRENIPLMKRAPIATIVNVSLWEVMRRSLATTFSTLLPVGALYFFGGETLRDFAFALLVGIGVGAYSSIFIAAPLLATLKQREPEFARRTDGAVTTKEDREAVLEQAEELAADQPAPALARLTPSDPELTDQAKRERRRQRRRARPHGRAR